MRLSILPRSPDGTQRLVYEFRRDVVRIGRRRSSDVCLPDPAVSLDHAQLARAGPEFFLVDEGSTNGTRLGPRRIEPGRRSAVRTGDILQLGPFSLLFEADEETSSAETTSEETALFARRILREMTRDRGPDADCPYLEVVSGAEAGARLRLAIREGDTPYRIGRAPECDLSVQDPDASREHVALVRDFSGVCAKDLDSKNGLLLNDRPLVGEPRLAHEDEIRIGATRLRFVDPIEATLRSLDQSDDAEPPPPTWRGERAAIVLAATALAGCVAIWIWLLGF